MHGAKDSHNDIKVTPGIAGLRPNAKQQLDSYYLLTYRPLDLKMTV